MPNESGGNSDGADDFLLEMVSFLRLERNISRVIKAGEDSFRSYAEKRTSAI